MKKIIIILSIIVLLLFAFKESSNDSNNIRVRVIANSNSYIDQDIKNDVVSIMKKVINADDSREDVKSKLSMLRNKVDNYGKSKNINITVEFKKTNFPAKSLNGEIIPSGCYETLLITIGKGKGNNYWSLLYPEYYGITFEDIDSGNIEYKSFFYELFN